MISGLMFLLQKKKIHNSLVKHSSFKGWQLKVIRAILEGKNALIVQPTGSGKSLCYQLPCTVTQKITIVLTPTISLMMDQVESLTSTGLQATFLGSAQKNTTVTGKVAQGQFDIIFCTPEFFLQSSGEPIPLFQTLISQKRVDLLAVDETHLISSAWVSAQISHSFRSTTPETHISFMQTFSSARESLGILARLPCKWMGKMRHCGKY